MYIKLYRIALIIIHKYNVSHLNKKNMRKRFYNSFSLDNSAIQSKKAPKTKKRTEVL